MTLMSTRRRQRPGCCHPSRGTEGCWCRSRALLAKPPGGLACSIIANAVEWGAGAGRRRPDPGDGHAKCPDRVRGSSLPALEHACGELAEFAEVASQWPKTGLPRGCGTQWLTRQLADGPVPVGSAGPEAAEPGTLRAAA